MIPDVPPALSIARPLRELIGRTIVVAHNERVDDLERSLVHEGLPCEVQRRAYTDEEQTFPASSRCFLNHRDAWKKASQLDGYTLICEADFVPCIGMGDFPSFWPLNDPLAYGYLYQGSPRIIALTPQRQLRAHCSPLVAYVINASVAALLLRFADDHVLRHPLREYSTFDSHVQWWLMGEGASAYMPMKHYGEHGGFPNREHQLMGGLAAAGVHRADNLMGPLHFLPPYARGSWLRYAWQRWLARAKGLGRLATGRWIVHAGEVAGSRAALYWVGIRRLAAV